jgi:hypothetical protein
MRSLNLLILSDTNLPRQIARPVPATCMIAVTAVLRQPIAATVEQILTMPDAQQETGLRETRTVAWEIRLPTIAVMEIERRTTIAEPVILHPLVLPAPAAEKTSNL